MKLSVNLQDLDKLDRKILSILLSNGRESVADISRTISLSRTAVAERINRLEKTGIIKGYTAQIRKDATGVNQTCYLHIQCANGRKEDVISHLKEIPEIRSVSVVGGQLDLVALIEAPTLLVIHSLCNEIEAFEAINNTSMLVILHRPIDR